ncbi:LysM peptidoglycan-binding domain-containing protein [Rhodanobacter glycinis]|uniref:N-acetylmuramoyl-L-alanine amidase AmiC n=1 Tax=Rhodanobacter glycinis TaxID=582702 RepID=A0A502FKP2_9GAMM|nr:N-acetylmuramoyl-L-alanine amidase [Rhodanobacter glycinis]TPG04483.1 LysM peptidoglycan-binding domain-containing protein [Rhodanobacter glycinis]TPG49981.1 LysM peptidoglycan-binding domain-containing protein [Rhodanobacter glycinis]
MRGYLNNLGGLVAVAILAITPVWAVRAADLKDARVWAGPDYTRLVLDASGPLHYTVSQKDGQVVVDLPNSRVTQDFSDPTAQGLYRGMSHARIGDRLQLTAKVDPDSRLKSFVLKPASGTDYRLVLDIYPGNRIETVSTAQHPPATTVAAPVVIPQYSNPTHSGRVATEQAAAMLNGQRAVVVAIDAGHGGKDPGSHGPGGTLEKNVTLAVARNLAAEINRQPGMKAVLTRDGDFFIPLTQRYRIARENNADLFVSIHADAFTSDDAKGSSVWVLSPRGKTSTAARWLADSENRADLIGGITLDDKDDGLAKVLLDLQQGWAMQASDMVAGNVLKALGMLGPTHRGYVERANFVVLRSPDVPSILVETAFISNPAEERKLRDPAHQKQLAEAVMGGVKNYFESTPPPGTWFAAQATRRNGVELASGKAASVGRSTVVKATGKDQVTLARNPAPSADDGVRDVHRVGRGESLRSIARQYGISVGALKNANQLSSDTVRAGAVLAIPTG